MQIPKLVLTGGPCGGKTTGMSYLQEKLSDRGFHPIIVPEAPTLLMLGNVTPQAYPETVFQHGVLDLMGQLERIWAEAAATRPELRPIMLCDRGRPDCPPYIQEPGFYERSLAKLGYGTPVEVRDGEYKAVFHMQSVAVDAPKFYTTANNKVRRETLEEAKQRDEKTLQAWLGHPHLRVIDNSTDFAGKLRRLDREICSVLGIPVPIEIERKYLCRPFPVMEQVLAPCRFIEIEQVYLHSPDPDKVVRVRKRGQDGSFVYYKTVKTELRPGARIEVEEHITKDQYEWSLGFADPGRLPIRKQRYCFVWESQYFELDVIPCPGTNQVLYLLELELTEDNQRIRLPDFIPVERDVTNDPAYGNYALAKAA